MDNIIDLAKIKTVKQFHEALLQLANRCDKNMSFLICYSDGVLESDMVKGVDYRTLFYKFDEIKHTILHKIHKGNK